jgi:hypothetical protein
MLEGTCSSWIFSSVMVDVEVEVEDEDEDEGEERPLDQVMPIQALIV